MCATDDAAAPRYCGAAARLAGTSGQRYWTSLEEIVDTAAFRDWLEGEFPAAAAALTQSGRREFLKIMGASLLLAGLGGCNEERLRPGATLCEPAGRPRPRRCALLRHRGVLEGFAQPVLATCHAGRPTKLDGNPDDAVNRGHSDAFTQAAVLQLYDPDRSQAPTAGPADNVGGIRARIIRDAAKLVARAGEACAFFSATTSPTLIRQLAH